jgi:hypothetical protein
MGEDLENVKKNDIYFLKLKEHFSADILEIKVEEMKALKKFKVEFMIF